MHIDNKVESYLAKSPIYLRCIVGMQVDALCFGNNDFESLDSDVKC